MPSIGLILSGCGVSDGTEIQEAVITMLCLDQIKAEVIPFAPDVNQAGVIDHTNGITMPESRNVRIESSRITRGKIHDIKEADPEVLDALIIPGGSGAMKNLSKIYNNPKQPFLNNDLLKLIKSMHSMKKPMGAICISPVLLAAALGEFKPRLTIGNDINSAAMITSFGGDHKECRVDQICTDAKNRIVSTPAYMLAKGPNEVYEGISALVDKIIELCE